MARPKIYEEATVVVSVRMPISLRQRLERLARKEKRSTNQQILLLIESVLAADETVDTAAPPASRPRRSKNS